MSEDSALCGYTEEVSTARFIYITAAGILAIAGCLSNLLLFYIFCTRRLSNSPPSLYPAVLSFLDSLLCILFVLIFVVDVNMIYLKNMDLFIVYHEYIVFAFSMVKVTQFLIPYMLMLATLERYTWITNRHRSLFIFLPSGRHLALVSVILLSLFLRIPSSLALTITVFPDCPDELRTLAVDVHAWAKDNDWYTFYDVYIIAFLQTFLPFLILISLNVVIVNRLAQIDSSSRHNGPEKTVILVKRRSVRLMSSLNFNKMTSSVRNAVFTMVAIVSTYLISNSLHILLTILEVGKASILMQEDDPYKASHLYTLLGDGVSLLYMTSSAIRIVIYVKCNPNIRRQLTDIVTKKLTINHPAAVNSQQNSQTLSQRRPTISQA